MRVDPDLPHAAKQEAPRSSSEIPVGQRGRASGRRSLREGDTPAREREQRPQDQRPANAADGRDGDQRGSSVVLNFDGTERRWLICKLRRAFPRLDVSDLEDVVQETLMLAIRYHDQCRADTSGRRRAWLAAIGRSVTLRHIAAAQRFVSIHEHITRGVRIAGAPCHEANNADDHPLGQVLGTIAAPCDDDAFIGVIDSVCAAGDLTPHVLATPPLLARERCLIALRQLVERLPASQQELLALHAEHSLTWQEIARLYGVTIYAVKRRFQRMQRSLGLQMLRHFEAAGDAEASRLLSVIWNGGRSRAADDA